ncbi:MAG: sugar phosphate isomerase/epimerase family protein [Thermoplasmatales archaeon]|nr:sugar phosphate isomerase/epimerase family protein [Thermoplasmatales archaeon]
MKIGISSPNFSLIGFEEILEKISKYFDRWEVVAEGKHYLWDIKEKFLEITPSYNIVFSVHAPLSDINIASLNPEMRKEAIRQINETIKISSDLGINLITMHPGHFSPLGALVPDEVKKINKGSVKQISKTAEEYNITIALENMPNQRITTCHSLKELLEIADNNVEICFDIGHANTNNNIHDFLDYGEFANVHIHDNFGKDDSHLVIGKGNIDFRNVLKKLRYNGFLIIESRGLKAGVESKNVLMKMI